MSIDGMQDMEDGYAGISRSLLAYALTQLALCQIGEVVKTHLIPTNDPPRSGIGEQRY